MHLFNLMVTACLSCAVCLFSHLYQEDEPDTQGRMPSLGRNTGRLVSAGFRSVLFRKKSRTARYLTTGLGLVFTGYLVYALSVFKILPVNGAFWFLTAGVAGFVLFALSLAERLETMAKAATASRPEPVERVPAEAHLQEKVALAEKANEALQKDVVAGVNEMARQAREIERLAKEMARQAGELAQVKQLLQDYTRKLEASVQEPKAQPKPERGLLPGRTLTQISEPARASKPEPNPKPEPPTAGVPAVQSVPQHDSLEAFRQHFPDDEACLKFLGELKWGGGYTCRKCGCQNYTKGKKPYTRRCLQCRYPESVISFTLFGNLKFPIVKAFYMTFLVSSGKNLTVDELSEIMSLRRQTCWTFKRKVKEVMVSRRHLPKPADGWSHLVLNVEESVSESITTEP